MKAVVAGILAAVLAACFVLDATAADKRPMKIDDLFAFKRVAAASVSDNAQYVAYQVTTVDGAANKTSSAIWLARVDGKGEPKQLTDPKGKKDTAPRWNKDFKTILFESNRSGSQQLWTVTTDGGEPKQITNISSGASNGIWSRDGESIAFVSAVYPEFSEKPFEESDKLNKEKDEALAKSPVKAKVFHRLFYRHWDSYVEDKRQHLFVCGSDGKAVRDVTPGDRDAYPTSTTFSSGDDFTFTPDSKHLVFSAVPAENEAWSTNYDLCRVSIDNKSTKWETLTADNKAADSGPKFNVKKNRLTWRAQKKAGYEADKWDLVVAECEADGTLIGKPLNVTEKFDLSVGEFIWKAVPGGHPAYFFTADQNGATPIFELDEGKLTTVVATGQNSSLDSFVSGVRLQIVFAQATMDRPNEVFLVDSTKPDVAPLNLTQANTELLASLDRPRPEAVKVKVEGADMHMWILKPPGFDDKKKWPVVYLIHGGPQGAWEDGWSNRWNPSLWAAQGYVVVMPNPRGSTGFGQKFVDEIAGDWGGKCYRDLVAGLDAVEKLPYVDKDRIATAGASFGGYMQNWFAVNDIAKRFKCQINHCSVWNFESMWGTTEELWFDEWEHGGLPWEKPGKYAEFSPHKRAGELGKNKVPMLVIQNDLDFRCPIGQGHELFSALQRQGVPSKMINFPDEGHWVLKPQNSKFWHTEVFAWLTKYCPPGGK